MTQSLLARTVTALHPSNARTHARTPRSSRARDIIMRRIIGIDLEASSNRSTAHLTPRQPARGRTALCRARHLPQSIGNPTPQALESPVTQGGSCDWQEVGHQPDWHGRGLPSNQSGVTAEEPGPPEPTVLHASRESCARPHQNFLPQSL